MKYADLVMAWLSEIGYTHCFFVAGGNSMHLLDGARKTMKCTPFVHEGSAGISAEYFNEISENHRAFVLVTAGPGITNLITAMAGAYLESRELLVIGGQVKSADLATNLLRQRGIQEINGVKICKPISKLAVCITQPINKATFISHVNFGTTARKGPVFLEFCLDVQGVPVNAEKLNAEPIPQTPTVPSKKDDLAQIISLMEISERPVLLLGGGIDRRVTQKSLSGLTKAGIPIMTTWNGADRIPANHPMYFGRPNTWGQRSSNILIQQSDLIIALGTRLGLQQTGFNWQNFAPVGKVIQVEIDPDELSKGHPHIDLPILADANKILLEIINHKWLISENWVKFCREVYDSFPLSEQKSNFHSDKFIDPFDFVLELSKLCGDKDIVIPCSSGGAFTTMMQAFKQKIDQLIVTDKGLASMGYGLAGAIGAAMAYPERRTILVEGDGGFSQNLQELSTAAVNNLNLKIFLFSNEGYASIRMTQRKYFDGKYLGCDTTTGLGFPNWELLAKSYSIPFMELEVDFEQSDDLSNLLGHSGPAFIVVPIDPEQTYFPKISSRITKSGGMESSPLHLMDPALSPSLSKKMIRYLP